ncbi:MAG TPA: glutamine synthetase type III [Saprospirales bacterium]|nr:glutamine synthetase type III [Saprospirales bacterium]
MTNGRKSAIDVFSSRPTELEKAKTSKISVIFNENVFTMTKMRTYLSSSAFASFRDSLENRTKISREIADQIASAIKSWAMEHGATHYTHWFQPLTGATAEKHDSFFTIDKEGNAIERLSGTELVQQEPDASSFPSGGLRATFEARGYTAWDPGSPAFIMDIGGGKTLCIPTVFISYTGEALDHKAPLIKSMEAIDKAATEVVKYFDRHVKKVLPTLGWEQEYFVIDKAMYYARPDLLANGRTVFGRAPAKGQQLDDHYFGAIPERVYAFMLDLENESHKLGIPLRTRHNEVAPSQFECAPMFEAVNVAVDHNQLLVNLMDRVARRHNLIVLTHEKPFAGINGSGKHNNWSLMSDDHTNLLSPGSTPRNNLQFLTFFINTIKAVHDHADLLRASIASESNDYRLGANEAPPAIMSVFVGSYLNNVLDALETRVDEDFSDEDEMDLKLDIHKMIPDIMMDNTDRNRTSPFAFTGNKFEFRAVGSSANCSRAMITLNTIMANQLKAFKKDVDILIKKGERRDSAILKVLRECLLSSKKIMFEGNNYSHEWEVEAAARGLNNIKSTPMALDALTQNKTIEVFTSEEVLSERELRARHEIFLEEYITKVKIEAKIIMELALNQILPAAFKYQSALADTISKAEKSGLESKSLGVHKEIFYRTSNAINGAYNNIELLEKTLEEVNEVSDTREKSIEFADKVKPFFEKIRMHVDELELLVDDTLWPLPKYREILFAR